MILFFVMLSKHIYKRDSTPINFLTTTTLTIAVYRWQYEIFSPSTSPELWVESNKWYFTLSACQKAAQEEELEVPDSYARRLNIVTKFVEVDTPSEIVEKLNFQD